MNISNAWSDNVDVCEYLETRALSWKGSVVAVGQQLAAAGFVVLAVDYYGHGLSDGYVA